MSTLLYSVATDPPVNPRVRETVSESPEANVFSSMDSQPDGTPEITTEAPTGGLQTANLASHVTTLGPLPPGSDRGGMDGMRALDSQWSVKGTAAQRENAGQWGHGLTIVEGIESAWRDAPFSDVYFDAGETVIQKGMVREVTGPDVAATEERGDAIAASRQAMEAARKSAYETAFGGDS